MVRPVEQGVQVEVLHDIGIWIHDHVEVYLAVAIS